MNRLPALSFTRSIRYFSSRKSASVSVFPAEDNSFTSPVSLSNIYPNSSLNAYNAPKDIPSCPEPGKFNGFIPINQLKIQYARSGGPGGQHVNKSNTKTTISFHLASADWIPESAREQLALLHKNSINNEGVWQIRSDKTRTTTLNLADCLDKLRCYITEAMIEVPQPTIETLEMKRLKAERAAAKRLNSKRIHAMHKRMKQVDLD